jgi:hypothetical protein
MGFIKGAFICKYMHNYNNIDKYFKFNIFISFLNNPYVLAMAAEKRKLEEITSSLKEENSQLKLNRRIYKTVKVKSVIILI